MKKFTFATTLTSKIALAALLASVTSISIAAKDRDSQAEKLVYQLVEHSMVGNIEAMAGNLKASTKTTEATISKVKESIQEKIKDITEVYTAEFSTKELQQLVNFFNGELGSKYNKFNVSLSQNADYMKLFTPILQEAMQSLQGGQAAIPQMVEASKDIEAISSQAELDVLTEENNVVVVKFYSDSCPPCRMLNGPYNDLVKDNSNIKFVSVNLEVAQELAQKYKVTSIPAVKIFKDSKLVDEVIGYNPDKLKELVVKHK
ncbi:MAG TPA: thioredoxin domain-containing protein [Candidatus Babeliales bacterium]|nr:thioredoxin domain-containing protein [Candidatus Babeliales bacterium]